MKFFEKRDRRGVACNPEQDTGLLTGGAGTLFDTLINKFPIPFSYHTTQETLDPRPWTLDPGHSTLWTHDSIDSYHNHSTNSNTTLSD